MGGFGSGRHQGAKKRRVEAHVALKLSDLRCERIPPGATELTLTYQLGEGSSAKSVVERVGLDRVTAGFGGSRTYLQCPGAGCGRRVMALYFVSGLFRCRRCHELAYEIQCEDAGRRAERRADKARARLRYRIWRPFELPPIVRPKGMWRSKFLRMQESIDAADYAATEAFVAGLKSLNARIDRRAARRSLR